MEYKLEIIKPNLYMNGDEIYFGIDSSDVISVGRSIDEIVKKHIGDLKVRESDLQVAESGKSKKDAVEYNIPLKKYLDILELKHECLLSNFSITSNSAKLFGLNHIISAQTMEKSSEVNDWIYLREDLVNPNKTFDVYEKDSPFKLNREKTLKEMEKLYEKLDQKMEKNHAGLIIMPGKIPSGSGTAETKLLGRISFSQLKSEDKSKIEETKKDLVEKLKEVDGPCLSFDAPAMISQMINLYQNSKELIDNYGDVLKSPNWKTRLFRLDP